MLVGSRRLPYRHLAIMLLLKAFDLRAQTNFEVGSIHTLGDCGAFMHGCRRTGPWLANAASNSTTGNCIDDPEHLS